MADIQKKAVCVTTEATIQARREVDLSTLTRCTLNENKDTELSFKPGPLHVIGGELWICQQEGVSVYNTELEFLRTVPRGDKGPINSAADTGHDVILAAYHGLFIVDYKGTDVRRVSDGHFMDVAYSTGKIFAAQFVENGLSIHVYDCTTWEHTTIDSPCKSTECFEWIHSLRTNGQCLVMACLRTSSVFTMSMDGALLSKKCGEGEATPQFRGPLVCAVDNDSRVLLCDPGNDRLLVCEADEWTVPDVPRMGHLTGAVCTQHALFVTSWHPQKVKKIRTRTITVQ